MWQVGMDVHKDSTIFNLFDPEAEPNRRHRRHRRITTPTEQGAIEAVLRPLNGNGRVAFEVGTQAQRVAQIVRPLAAEVQVANPSRMPWLFRDGRKNDNIDSFKMCPGAAALSRPREYE